MISPEEGLVEVVSKINNYEDVNIDDVKHWLAAAPHDLTYNLLVTPGYFGNTALHDAACSGLTDLVALFLNSVNHEKRVEMLKVANRWGNTVLDYAALNNRVDTIETIYNSITRDDIYSLLQFQKPLGTPLHTAVDKGHLNSFKSMLTPFSSKQRKFLLGITNRTGETVLSVATRHNRMDIVDCIQEKLHETSLLHSLRHDENGKLFTHESLHYKIKR